MSKSKIIATTVVVVVAVLVIIKVIPKEDDDRIVVPPTEPIGTTAPVTVPATKETMPVSVYKDGSYSARGKYYSPAGLENITVSVTLKNGLIVDTSAVGEATNEKSIRYQGMFVENYKQYVIGKSIDSVRLDKVSGSSLTGEGFNDAISKIKTEARA